MPAFQKLEDVPRAFGMALAAHAALGWIGFDMAEVFCAIGLPHPNNEVHCPPDHRWITVHLKTQDKEFVIDCGSVPVEQVDEQSWPSCCEVWQPLSQDERLAYRMRWIDDLMLALMMTAIQDRGIVIPELEKQRAEALN